MCVLPWVAAARGASRSVALAFIACFFVLPQLLAQEPGAGDARGRNPASPTIYTTKTEIRLDGRLDEGDWAKADSIADFHQREPVEGGTPSERTVVRLLATPSGLAVGWWCYDRDPRGIRRSRSAISARKTAPRFARSR